MTTKNYLITKKKEYNVYPKMQVFQVFNVAQTNLQEARPELWQKLEKEYSLPNIENGEYFSFAPVDALIKDNSCGFVRSNHSIRITLTTLYREMKSLCRKRNSSNLERRSSMT